MPFVDVPANAYYHDAVLLAVEQGITTGTGDGKFSPDAPCTRAQSVSFLWRSQKSAAPGGVNPFTDVAADAYYSRGAVGGGQRRHQWHQRHHLQPQQQLHPRPDRDLPVPLPGRRIRTHKRSLDD